MSVTVSLYSSTSLPVDTPVLAAKGTILAGERLSEP
jgi:hypothetical protein